MTYDFNEDRWAATLVLSQLGVCEYFVEAWKDSYSTKIQDARKWIESGEDVSTDIAELSRRIGVKASIFASPAENSIIKEQLNEIAIFGEVPFSESDQCSVDETTLGTEFLGAVVKNLDKEDYTTTNTFQVIVDRSIARYSTWYEMFHRSQGTIQGRSANFKECESRLGEFSRMGFDVVYLPPIHPIGHTNRRGPNNTQSISELDPGSPWAIGSELGGHDSINPDLGTMDDFCTLYLKRNGRNRNCTRFAFQVSPDHPYAKNAPRMVLSKRRWYNPICRESAEEILRYLSFEL